MRVEYHPLIPEDVAKVIRRYHAVSNRLVEEFEHELRRVISIAATNPGRFHPIRPGFYRANLKRFPYHFIYRQVPGGIRVVVLKHHRRNPELGMERV